MSDDDEAMEAARRELERVRASPQRARRTDAPLRSAYTYSPPQLSHSGARIAIVVAAAESSSIEQKIGQWLLLQDRRASSEAETVDLSVLTFESSNLLQASPYDPRTAQLENSLERFDGYIFIVRETAHAAQATMQLALEHASQVFRRKAVAFVGLGEQGAARAISQLSLMLGELGAVCVRSGLVVSGQDYYDLANEVIVWEQISEKYQIYTIGLLDNLVWWTVATKHAREKDDTSVLGWGHGVA